LTLLFSPWNPGPWIPGCDRWSWRADHGRLV